MKKQEDRTPIEQLLTIYYRLDDFTLTLQRAINKYAVKGSFYDRGDFSALKCQKMLERKSRIQLFIYTMQQILKCLSTKELALFNYKYTHLIDANELTLYGYNPHWRSYYRAQARLLNKLRCQFIYNGYDDAKQKELLDVIYRGV